MLRSASLKDRGRKLDHSNTSYETCSLVTARFVRAHLSNLRFGSKLKSTVKDTAIPKVGYTYLSLAVSVAGQCMYLKVGPWVDGLAAALTRR